MGLDIVITIQLVIIGALVGIDLICLVIITIYNKATAEKFRQERIRRLTESREREEPFFELKKTDKEISNDNSES